MNAASKKLTTPYPVPPLSAQELKLVAQINTTWTKQQAHATLRSTLQAAMSATSTARYRPLKCSWRTVR